MHWRAHFGDQKLLTLEEAGRAYPNATGLVRGNAFISHAGKDTGQIRNVITPCIHMCYNGALPDPIFFHNSSSGGGNDYKHIVLLALDNCAFSIVVVSANSAEHVWVAAEVDWLIEHRRSIAICLLDSTSPNEIDPRFSKAGTVDAPVFDFAADASRAAAALGEWIKSLGGSFWGLDLAKK
jgi:hypothetical protein